MDLAFKITAAATPLGTILLTLDKESLEAGSGFRVELTGLGAGRIVINRNRPECTAANFAQDNYVRVYDLDLSAVIPLGGFFLDDEQVQVLSRDEEGGEVVQFGGPGALSYFGRCALWNINYVNFGDDAHYGPRSDGLWYWYNDQYGDILKRMIDEAQDADRPAAGHGIDDLTYDFTSTTDSAGDSWDSFVGNYTLPTGTNYLDIAQRLRDVGLTIQVSGDLLMQAYQGFYGVDRTSAIFATGKVRFVNVDGAAGANIVEELARQSHPSLQLSRVLVQGDSGEPSTMVTRVAASYNVPREGYAQYPSSHALATLQNVGDQALQIRSDSSDVPTFRHIPGVNSLAGLYSPFPGTTDETVVATSSSWKIALTGTPPAGWHDAGFDDSLYANAVNVSNGGGPWYDYGSSRWIWEDEATGSPPVQPSGEERSFRHEFTLAAVPETARVFIAADNGCEVYVNGTLVATHGGSERGAPDTAPHNYDTPGTYNVDTSVFVVGANCISIIGWNETATPNAGPAGVYAVLTLDVADGIYWLGDIVTLHTGTEMGDYTEVDLRVYAINWELDDDEWWPRPELGGLLQLATATTPTAGVASVAGSGSGGVVTVTSSATPPMTVERELTNKSGGAVARGDQVVIDPSNDEAFITSTVAGETRQLGIAQEDIASNVKGRIAVSGYVELVNCVASVTRGQYGYSSGTVKLVKGYDNRAPGAFCQFLKSGTEPSAILWAIGDPPVSWKRPVRAATTASGTMATSFENGDTIDGVVLATGDRILIKDQASADNGIYVVQASGAPVRASDLKASAEALGAAVFVTEGTANGNKAFFMTTDGPITLGTTVLLWAALSSGSSGHTVKEDGTPLTTRSGLNFGSGIVATDDAGNDETDVDIDWAEDADVSTQAFGDAAATGTSQEVARGGHKHGMPANPFVEGTSAKASGTGDVTTTGSLQDLTGASLSLAAGTWVVIGTFDVKVNNSGNDKLFEGHLDVATVDENDIATLLGVGLDDADRATITQHWRVTLGSTQTVKLRAKHSGGATGDFTVLGANTTLVAIRAGMGFGQVLHLTPLSGNSHGSFSTVGASNNAIFRPIRIPGPCTVSGVRVNIGTSSGNIDVGLYDTAFNRLASSGSVASPGTGLRTISFSAAYTITQPGDYYLAIAAGNNTVTFSNQPGTTNTIPGNALSQGTAFPLPNPAAPTGEIGNNAQMFNMIGIVTGGWP